MIGLFHFNFFLFLFFLFNLVYYLFNDLRIEKKENEIMTFFKINCFPSQSINSKTRCDAVALNLELPLQKKTI